jgi:hypothetical protein
LKPATLVIFDYSGTLSLGAVNFGRPEILARHLEKSGLAGIGIDTADRYWNNVVNPTWTEASTTTAGIKSIAAGRIKEMEIPGATSQSIELAVSKFVDQYMRHSRIDEKWRPLLSDIQNLPGVKGIVATDHYAEATGAVRMHLAALDIKSVPATGKETLPGDAAFIVANSADIGYPKTDRQFWLTLTKARLSMPVKDVILVDDFGLNEQDRSGYSEARKIESRIDATRETLGGVFGVEPQVIHFIAGIDPDKTIIETINTILKILKK